MPDLDQHPRPFSQRALAARIVAEPDAVLVTRDTRRYRTHFPGIALIVPN
jgi:hypothetical protein